MENLELHRGFVMHAPTFDGALKAYADGYILVEDGRVAGVGDWHDRPAGPRVTNHQGAFILPGFVDTHVHLPQLAVVGSIGKSLLEWLAEDALPEELRWADPQHARTGSREFLSRLLRNGTTSCLAFGSHFPEAMEIFFGEAETSGLRVTSGLVLGDTNLPEGLLTDAERALQESRRLAGKWHGRGRLRYAVTPRFTVSATSGLLAACGELLAENPDLFFTTHLNEMPAEIDVVLAANPAAGDYLATYEAHGLLTRRSLFAHNVHPTDSELARLAAADSSVCHCPGSNMFLGSGLFPLRRHLEHGVRVALGSDVGAGTSYSLPGEALHTHMHQMLLPDGLRLEPAQLLHLATRAGAEALELDDCGSFEVGMQFDAVVLAAPAGSTLAARLPRATGPEDALSALITLSREESVRSVYVAGEPLLVDGREVARG